MFVKICGLTNLEDSLAASNAGAQALGFNFVKSSPRFIEAADLAQWIERIPAHIWKVGVFADETAAHVIETCQRFGLQVAQLHGNESPEQIPSDLRVWKAFRLQLGFNHAVFDNLQTEAILFDGPASGIPFDWTTACPQGRNVILAGGLHSGNVRQAIAAIQPWGVDVCSRIEISPRQKDHNLMTQFVQTALSC